jgi:hypothetical protein
MLTTNLTDVRSETPPLFLTDAEMFRHLWRGLKEILQVAGVIRVMMRVANEQIAVVDKFPRHDSQISETELDFSIFRRCAINTSSTLSSAIFELKQAQESLQRAKHRIDNRLHGTDRVSITDRLERHLHEGQALLESLQARAQTCAVTYKPFEVRRQYMMSLLLDLNDLHARLTHLRAQCKGYKLLDQPCEQLLQHAEQTGRLRAKLAKWRDNPSQKLGAKMSQEYQQFEAMRLAIEELRNVAETRCRQLGVKFYNRQGEC